MPNFINFEVQTGTGIIHLNRPDVLNALNLEMAKLFFYKLNEWQSDRSIERVLLIGEGKAFCAGGDIKSLFLASEKSYEDTLKLAGDLGQDLKKGQAISDSVLRYLAYAQDITIPIGKRARDIISNKTGLLKCSNSNG